MIKKIIIIYILFSSCFSVFSNTDDAKDVVGKDNTTDTKKIIFNKPDNLTISKIAYWSSYSATGLFGFSVSIAYLGYSNDISQEMLKIAEEFQDAGLSKMALFTRVAEHLPLIYFTGNFILSGLAQIPKYGGVIYGSMLLTAALCSSVILIFNPIELFWSKSIKSTIGDEYKEKLNNIHKRMFDPTSCIVLGAFSILFGIVEIVTNYYYNREIKRSKYPSVNKMFSVTPNGIVIKIDA